MDGWMDGCVLFLASFVVSMLMKEWLPSSIVKQEAWGVGCATERWRTGQYERNDGRVLHSHRTPQPNEKVVPSPLFQKTSSFRKVLGPFICYVDCFTDSYIVYALMGKGYFAREKYIRFPIRSYYSNRCCRNFNSTKACCFVHLVYTETVSLVV
jgi:hypothetical protein